MKSSASKIQLTGFNDLFQVGGDTETDAERVQEVPLSELFPFKGHPFQVRDDEAMQETAASIAKYGVLVPGIVRPRSEGGYELVSGHRRKRGSELAGKETMPVIVRALDDDEAIIIMVDSNLQREKILPSEKAFAYKMKLEAIKHQGKRTDLTLVRGVPKLPAREQIAKDAGEKSGVAVTRYIALTTLVLDGEIIRDLISYTDSVDEYVGLDAVWTPYFDFRLDGNAAFDDGTTGIKHILKTDLDKLPVAVRDGWAFLGWYDDIAKRYVDLTYVLSLDECRSFRAVFTPEITFDGNGGQVIVDGTGYDSYTIGLSTLVEQYGRFFDARCNGRTFMGWVSSDTSDLTMFENIVNRNVPMTLVASWGVGITFQMPSGTIWADSSEGDRTYTAQEVGEWETLPTVYLEGYTFVEWQNANGRAVTPAGLSASEESVAVRPLFKAETGPSRGIDVTVTNYAPDKASWQAPAGGWTAGSNTFTVASDMACAVALVRNGELTVLSCEHREADTYAFTAELTDGDEIVIVLVGDSDLDGRLTAADLVCLSRHFGGERDLSACAVLATDTDLDGRLTAADLVCLSRYFGGGYTLCWRLTE